MIRQEDHILCDKKEVLKIVAIQFKNPLAHNVMGPTWKVKSFFMMGLDIILSFLTLDLIIVPNSNDFLPSMAILVTIFSQPVDDF